jgi:hypothetical protein
VGQPISATSRIRSVGWRGPIAAWRRSPRSAKSTWRARSARGARQVSRMRLSVKLASNSARLMLCGRPRADPELCPDSQVAIVDSQ